MGAAADALKKKDPRFHHNETRSHFRQNLDNAEAGKERRDVVLRYARDVLLGRKKPSRDESTWGDRTGKEDEEYEKQKRYEESVKAHKTKAGFIGTRG